MIFHYVAAQKGGKIVEGDLEVDSFPQALQNLSSQELRPISVKPLKDVSGGAKGPLLFGKINLMDKIFITRYLSLMLKVGTDLLGAINILISDFEKPAIKSFLIEVRDNLSRGQPFYSAFAKHPKTFSPVFINLVKAAEASGNLQSTFDELAADLNKEAALRNTIRAALVYPIILLITSLVIFIFLVTFALPKIARVFLDGGIDPPLFSKVVFSIGLYVNAHAFLIIGGFIALVTGSLFFFIKTDVGKKLAQRVFTRLPILRNVYKELAIQRFAATVSSLMKAGLPIIQALTISADTVNVYEFRTSLIRISEEGLAKGLTIGEAFKRETVFPRLVSNLIAASEKAGHLEDLLQTLSEFYASRAEAAIKSLVSFLEPMLLLVMGLLVGLVALSIIIPIYQLTSQFS